MRVLLVFGLVSVLSGCARTPATQAHGRPVDYWVQALRDPDARVRKKAVGVLGNVGPADPAALPALTAAVRDPDAGVRNQAVLALLKWGPDAREAVAALEQARRDRDPRVRASAVTALEKIQGNQ
jgi:HEAT repeat protein